MHCRWRSTMSRHWLPASALSSWFEPNRRKQSSRAFFVSGQAQQLRASSRASARLDDLRRESLAPRRSQKLPRRPDRSSPRETHGLSPSGFRGLSWGFAASEPVNGRFSVGWNETGPEGGGGAEGDGVLEEGAAGVDEKGHMAASAQS